MAVGRQVLHDLSMARGQYVILQARSDLDNDGQAPQPCRGCALEVKADEPPVRTFTVKLRSAIALRRERVARRLVAAPPEDVQHGLPR